MKSHTAASNKTHSILAQTLAHIYLVDLEVAPETTDRFHTLASMVADPAVRCKLKLTGGRDRRVKIDWRSVEHRAHWFIKNDLNARPNRAAKLRTIRANEKARQDAEQAAYVNTWNVRVEAMMEALAASGESFGQRDAADTWTDADETDHRAAEQEIREEDLDPEIG